MYELLRRAVGELSARCDGASSEDGTGFNKIDSFYGKSMNGLDKWSQRQAHAVWRMIGKYRDQLAGYGVDYDEIPAPGISEKKLARRMCMAGDAIAISFEYNPELVENIKEIPKHSRRYDPDTRAWTVTPTLAIIDQLVNYATHYEFEVDDDVYKTLAGLVEQHQKLLAGSRAADSDFEIKGLGGTPYPFQLAGIQYAVASERCFIADQMGLGKTIEALGTLWVKESFPAIIVCPASVKYNWAIETLKWLPGKRVGMVKGKVFYTALMLSNKRIFLDKARHQLPGGYDIIIINYDILKPRPRVWRCTSAYTNVKQEEFEVGDVMNEPIAGFTKDYLALVKIHWERDGYGDSKNGLIEKLKNIKPQALVIDESQLTKSYKSQRTKGVTQLS